MERDFLSSSFQKASINAKEESNDNSKKSVSERSSGMQWSFSSKVSAVPQLLSFKSSQENRPRYSTVNDPLGASTLMTISSPETYDSNHKTFSGTIQRNFIQEKQVGSHYSMTVYNPQDLSIHSNQPSQVVPVALNAPVFQSRVASNATNTMRSHHFGGLPVVPSAPAVHPNGSVVGTTDLSRNAAKPGTVPAQLTIFYGGSVNVYEDISPEKAQAIMLLAGNGSSPSHNKQIYVAPVEEPAPRPTTTNSFMRSWSFSGLPSQVPMTIRADTQSGGSCHNTNVISIVKTVGASASSSNNRLSETKITGPSGPTTFVLPTAVPQARKASLARFLEKRKERVISASPYDLPQKSSDCGVTGSDGMTLSINSSSNTPLSAMN